MPDGGGTVYNLHYCRLCGNKVCDFQKVLVLPFSPFGALALIVMELLMYFQQSLSISEMINLPFPTMELVPILAFIGSFYRENVNSKSNLCSSFRSEALALRADRLPRNLI